MAGLYCKRRLRLYCRNCIARGLAGEGSVSRYKFCIVTGAARRAEDCIVRHLGVLRQRARRAGAQGKARRGAGHGAQGRARARCDTTGPGHDTAGPSCDTALGGATIWPCARGLGVPMSWLGVLAGSARLCVCTLCT